MVAIEGVLNDSLNFCISALFEAGFQHRFCDLNVTSVPDFVKPIPQRWVEDVEVALDEGFGAEDGDVLGQGPTVHWTQEEGRARLQAALHRLDLRKEHVTHHNIHRMGKNEVNTEKRRVKQELKRYDTEFKKQFGRLPNHTEKEPMRPLYVYYRRLKTMLLQMERGGGGHRGGSIGSDDETALRPPKEPLSTIQDQDETPRSPTRSGGRHATVEDQINALETRVETLQNEMDFVRTKLRTFQERFVQENNRKIRFHKDILPIEREYRMYKSFKDELSKAEQQLRALRSMK